MSVSVPQPGVTRRRNLRLIDCRVRHGWTQPELARRSKCSLTTINQAEVGKLVPILLTQQRIAHALHVERDWLFAAEAYQPQEVPA